MSAEIEKIKKDIQKFKNALKSKNLSASFKEKIKKQLQKAENDLIDKSDAFKSAKLRREKQAGVPKNKTDIERDAERPAMPTGRRVSKGLRANSSGSKSSNKGHVYYEYRDNRIDKKQPPKKYPKLEDGGMMDSGGSVKEGNKEMILSNVKSIKHHAQEISNTLGEKGIEVEAWVNAKAERAATDLSDITHYLDGLKMKHGGMVHGDDSHNVHTKDNAHRLKN